MGVQGKFAATTVLAAMLLTATTPAMAREGRWHRHHDRGRISTGEAIGAVALIGLVAALASKKPKPVAYEPAPPPPPNYGGDGNGPPVDPREAAAVDACVDYVGRHFEEEQDRVGRVEHITDVTPKLNGGYKVRGVVRVQDWDGRPIQVSRFKCSVNASGNSRSLTIT